MLLLIVGIEPLKSGLKAIASARVLSPSSSPLTASTSRFSSKSPWLNPIAGGVKLLLPAIAS